MGHGNYQRHVRSLLGFSSVCNCSMLTPEEAANPAMVQKTPFVCARLQTLASAMFSVVFCLYVTVFTALLSKCGFGQQCLSISSWSLTNTKMTHERNLLERQNRNKQLREQMRSSLQALRPPNIHILYSHFLSCFCLCSLFYVLYFIFFNF